MFTGREIKRQNESYSTEITINKKMRIDDDYEQKLLRSLGVNDFCELPAAGKPVNRKEFRWAGPFIIGHEILGHRPVRSIVHYLARKADTNKFFLLKILQLSIKDGDNESHDERHGKMLLHTEYSLLSLLQNEEGVIKCHGMFSDVAMEETRVVDGKSEYTGVMKRRIILVLDCLIQHKYCDKSASYISLQEYLTNMKKLSENEALFIFYEIVKIVENIHKKNIIHRDLKLGNIVFNRNSKKVILTNFCLGKYLINENTLLYDQKGSPAYISPDVVSGKGKPYKGKPSDMWSLGVIFFMMLYGSFPFFKSTSTALFAQIQSGEYHIPPNADVSSNSLDLVRGLLNVNADNRLNATELRRRIESLLALTIIPSPDHCVPSLSKKLSAVLPFKKLHDIYNNEEQVVPLQYLGNNQDKSIGCNNHNHYGISSFPSDLSQTIENNKYITNNINNKPRTLTQIGIHVSETMTNITGLRSTTSVAYSNEGAMIMRRIFSPSFRNGSSSNSNGNEIDGITNNTNITSSTNPSFQFISEPFVQNFISQLDQHFAQGRLRAPRNRPLLEFNGILSNDIACSLQRWLLQEFSDSPLIQQIFLNSNDTIINKVKTLLMRCGVQIEISIFGPRVLRTQNIHVLVILTYMLKASGYNNTYFITQLATSSM